MKYYNESYDKIIPNNTPHQIINLNFNNLDVSGNLSVKGAKIENQNVLQQSLFSKCKLSFLHVVTGDLNYSGSASFVDLSEYNFDADYDYILTAAHIIVDDSGNLYDNLYFHTNTEAACSNRVCLDFLSSLPSNQVILNT